MDKEPEEMQYLGVWGIMKEGWKLMRSYGRLLASLTATLVLPLCFVVLAHHLLSDPLARKLQRQEDVEMTEEGTPAGERLRQQMDKETIGLIVMGIVYVLFVLSFSMLAFAAIVYSVACIYTGKGVSYSKVLSVVPKVWRRLMVTLLWSYLGMFAYEVVGLVGIVLIAILSPALGVLTPLVFFLFLGAFFVVLLYLIMIWDLANVISVLEESYGLGAVKKSVHLLKGKRLVACALVLIYGLPHIIISELFQGQVVDSQGSGWARVLYAALLISLFSSVWLMGLIVQSVLYFVCKAHHHESIDRYALGDHLDGYLGEYMPLKDPIPLETLEP